MRICPDCRTPAVEYKETWQCNRCGRSGRLDEPVMSVEPPRVPVHPPHPDRKSEGQIADLNAVYARHLGRNGPEAERQENLLKDARAWAAEELRKIIADGVEDVQELKAHVVKKTWDEFVRVHAFPLGSPGRLQAIWEGFMGGGMAFAQ